MHERGEFPHRGPSVSLLNAKSWGGVDKPWPWTEELEQRMAYVIQGFWGAQRSETKPEGGAASVQHDRGGCYSGSQRFLRPCSGSGSSAQEPVSLAGSPGNRIDSAKPMH